MNESLRQILMSPTATRVMSALVAVAVVVLVVRLVNRVLSRTITDAGTRYRSRKIVTFLGYAVVILLIIAVASGNLGAFGVTIGVMGAAIAFALQEVIASVAGWLSIQFGGLFTVGNRVQLAGIRGDVIDIGILRTTLMECGEWVSGDLYDGRIVRIANSFVFKEPVFNYSADFPFLWDEITIPVRYGSDVERARALIKASVDSAVQEYSEVARATWETMTRKYRIEEAQVEPMVTLVANDNWMQFTARYVVDYRRRRTTRDRIFTRLLQEIGRTDGAVALASATFELVQVPALDVRVRAEHSDGRAG